MPNKTMTERIARALCLFDGHPENAPFEGQPMWRSYCQQAQAILISMRGPTSTMVSAGDAAGTRDEVIIWNAMIDAALAERADL